MSKEQIDGLSWVIPFMHLAFDRDKNSFFFCNVVNNASSCKILNTVLSDKIIYKIIYMDGWKINNQFELVWVIDLQILYSLFSSIFTIDLLNREK